MVDRNKHQSMFVTKLKTSITRHPFNGRAKSQTNYRRSVSTTVPLPEHNEAHDAGLLVGEVQVRVDL